MTVATLRPAGTTTNNGVAVIGAGSAHAALADDSDSSQCSFFGSEDELQVSLGDVTLPAGALVRDIVVRLRTAMGGSSPWPVVFSLTGIDHRMVTVVASWSTPTTTSRALVLNEVVDEAQIDAADLRLTFPAASSEHQTSLYEAWVDVVYVEQPLVAVSGPSGTIADTTNPTIAWAATLASDGGAQTHYEVKIATTATPGTVIATSGIAEGPATSWTTTEPLAGAFGLPVEYVASVRVGQTVNGAIHWSDWDTTTFEVEVDRPSSGTLTVTPDPTIGGYRLEMATAPSNVGAHVATTDYVAFERSIDEGATWARVRTLRADGLVVAPPETGPGDTVFTEAYDVEAPIATPVWFRAQAFHDYGDGLMAGAGWTTSIAHDVLTCSWWLKHPTDPSLSVPIAVHAFPQIQRAAVQGIHYPAGRPAPVVVSAPRRSITSSITVRVDSAVERAALDELLDTLSPLLLHGPAAHGWTDAWISIGDLQRNRLVDKAFIAETLDPLPFVVVDRPEGVLDAWPETGS